MRYLMAACVALGVAGSCEAGTITKSQVKHNLSLREVYTHSVLGGICSTQLRCTLSTTLDADITVDEENGLGPDTVIEAGFPLGPSASFRLTDDPNYQPGDTSARIQSSTLFNFVTWKRTINISWGNGRLRLKATVKATQKFSKAALVEWENVVASSSNTTTPFDIPVALSARNVGTEFLSLAALVPGKIKSSLSLQPAKAGISRSSKQAITGAL